MLASGGDDVGDDVGKAVGGVGHGGSHYYTKMPLGFKLLSGFHNRRRPNVEKCLQVPI